MRPYEVWRKGLLYSSTPCLLSYPWQNKQHLPGDLCSVHSLRSSGPGAWTCLWTPPRPLSRTCPGCPSRGGETSPCPHPYPPSHSCSPVTLTLAVCIEHSTGSHISISNRFLESRSRFPFSISRVTGDNRSWHLAYWASFTSFIQNTTGASERGQCLQSAGCRDLCLGVQCASCDRLLISLIADCRDWPLAACARPRLPVTAWTRALVGEERRERVYRQLLLLLQPFPPPPSTLAIEGRLPYPDLHCTGLTYFH